MDELLEATRFLQFTAGMQLFGCAFFISALAPAGPRAELSKRLRPIAIASLAIVLVTTLAWLALAAGEMGSGWSDTTNPATLATVLTETDFGRLWQARLGGCVLLALAPLSPRKLYWPITAVLSGILLASLGLTGHAAMADGLPGVAGRASQVLHLLATGFWLGSLYPLVLCLSADRTSAQRDDLVILLSRFSGLGHVAVAVVLATGIASTLLIVGKLPLDPSSAYQMLLAAKIGVVLLTICFALANRYIFLPRLGDDGLAALRRGTLAEIGLGLCAIGLVSVLGMLDPS